METVLSLIFMVTMSTTEKTVLGVTWRYLNIIITSARLEM